MTQSTWPAHISKTIMGAFFLTLHTSVITKDGAGLIYPWWAVGYRQFSGSQRSHFTHGDPVPTCVLHFLTGRPILIFPLLSSY